MLDSRRRRVHDIKQEIPVASIRPRARGLPHGCHHVYPIQHCCAMAIAANQDARLGASQLRSNLPMRRIRYHACAQSIALVASVMNKQSKSNDFGTALKSRRWRDAA
jgi:hypothetical protein